jgi:hypothetical protein
VIAEDTGGDTMQVADASALQDTLERLRQRYALHFSLPEGSQVGDRQKVQVELSQEARLRYLDAEIRYRRVLMSTTNAAGHSGPTEITRAPRPIESAPETTATPEVSEPADRRHGAVNEDSGPVINTVKPDEDSGDSTTPQKPAGNQTPPPATAPAPSGGWPKAPGSNPN